MSYEKIDICPSRNIHTADCDCGFFCVGVCNAEGIEALRIGGSNRKALHGFITATSLRGVATNFAARGLGIAPRAGRLALAGLVATTCVSATFALTTPAHALQLIQCPDWRSLVKQVNPVALAKSSPKTPFDVAVLQENLKPLSHKDPVTPAAKTRRSSAKVNTAPLSSASCPTYKVKAGDTLSDIAQKMLGSAKRHPELLAANAKKVKSANTLKIGTTLVIPCAQPKPIVKPLPKRARGLFKKSNTAELPAPKAVVKAKPAPVIVPTPKPIPLPVWRAKSGEYLTDTLRRWGKTAGYKVFKEGTDDWRLSVPISVQDTFEGAMAQLVRGFEGTGRPPGITIYSNKVVKVGAP